MDPQPIAPPVVAVVVTSDPGPWLEEALTALGAQDYPNLSVLVLDAGSERDLTNRVATVLPGAYVRRLPENRGFGWAANHVFETVSGSAFFAFLHDDVAPAPDAVRLLVEEALRSNAGVVGPKLVEWDEPERLLEVGLGVDKTAARAPLVERGELDQEQYDAVLDVFAVSDALMLVRADLFTTLGGFDAAMLADGGDVDLCWRAQIAGARVLVAPAARARHLEDGYERRVDLAVDRTGLRARSRVRTVLKNYGLFHLMRVVPQALAFTLAEASMRLLGGHVRAARRVMAAWPWNFRHWGAIRTERRANRRHRLVPDGEVRRLQLRGSALATTFVRSHRLGDRPHPVFAASRNIRSMGTRAVGTAATIGVLTAAVMLFGSRRLITGRVPGIAELAPFPHGVGTFFGQLVSGWRLTGLGAAGPAPPSFGLLGLAGVASLGHLGFVRTVLVVGAAPVAAIGSWRLTRPLGSLRARLVAVVVTAAIPLPYNAIARGRLSGLIAYAAAPWLLSRLFRETATAPFGPRLRPRWRAAVGLGVLLALAAALAPAVIVAVVVAAVGLALGSVVSGDDRGALRPLALAIFGAVVAIVLLFPWSVQTLTSGSGWRAVLGIGPATAHPLPLGALLRFQTGPIGAAPLGWAFLVAAALPLLIGNGWRLSWAVRLWMVALVTVGAAWAGGQGWIPVPAQDAEVFLAPAAIALALSAGLGAAAFELDLPGYRFGLRQLATFVAGAAVVLGALPVLSAAVGGRWHAPAQDWADSLSWMRGETRDGAFRVLWVGSPDVLPVDGWKLGGGMAYATSRNGPPDFADRFPPGSPGPTHLLGNALTTVANGATTRLGRMVAPMAVRYIVVCEAAAPGRTELPHVPAATGLARGIDSQLDLKQLPSDPSLTVYENTAWWPARSTVPPDIGDPARAPLDADFSGVDTVLGRGRSPVSLKGRVRDNSRVFLSEASSPRWQLRVDSVTRPHTRAFGWANQFDVDQGGPATLRFRTPLAHLVGLVVELALWAAAIVILTGRLGRRPEAEARAESPRAEPERADAAAGARA